MVDTGVRLSPSQVESAECLYAWGLSYLSKIDRGSTPQADAGVRLHKLLETFFRTGVLPLADQEGLAILAAREHFPAWSSGLSPEMPLYDVSFADVLFGSRREGREMRCDLVDARDPTTVKLYDLKTTSNLKWAKSAEQLQSNLQASVYCRGLFVAFPGCHEVHCRWVYVTRPTKSRTKSKCLPVDFVMTRDIVAEVEKRYWGRINELLRYHIEKPDVESLPKNVSHCGAYGGCSYGPLKKNICTLTTQERLRSILKMPNTSTNGANKNNTMQNDINNLLKQTVKPGAPVPSTPVGVSTAKKSFSAKKSPLAPPVFDPATFKLPLDGDGQAIDEENRKAYIEWALSENENLLSAEGAEMTPGFIARCRAYITEVEEEPATEPSTETSEPLEEPEPSQEPEEEEDPTDPAVEEPDTLEETPIRRGGRPKGSKNRVVSVNITMTEELCDKLLGYLSKMDTSPDRA